MNRSNVGNIVTNGMQILSVGATTASRVFKDRADSALNNLSPEERKGYFEMKANKMRDEMKKYNSKNESVDDLMGYTENLRNVGEEGENIAIRVDKNIGWLKDLYKERDEPLENVIKEALEGEENNADV